MPLFEWWTSFQDRPVLIASRVIILLTNLSYLSYLSILTDQALCRSNYLVLLVTYLYRMDSLVRVDSLDTWQARGASMCTCSNQVSHICYR